MLPTLVVSSMWPRGMLKLRLSPTTMVDTMAMDLDTMVDMAMDMSMARGKPRLRPSPTTTVDDMAMDVYGKREAEAEAKPYYYGGLYGHGLGYYGGYGHGYVYGKREAEAEAKPYYYGGLYGHGLGYYGGYGHGYVYGKR